MPRAVAWLTLLVLPAAGCDGCPGGHPYTPYALDSGVPAIAASAGSSSAAPQPGQGAFVPTAAKRAAEGGARWVLDGEAITAPAGRVFDTGLELDVDGDGRRDLLAWARSTDGSRGELVVRRGGRDESPRVVAAPPADVLDAPKCTTRAGLSQVGARAALVDVSSECPPEAARDAPRTARWLGVVQLDALTRLVLDVAVPRLANGESLRIELAASDGDGDGREDVTASIALEGAPAPFSPEPAGGETVTLRWLDRPQGMSPDPAEPTASLAARSAALAASARNKTDATTVRARAKRLRRLVEVACGAGPTALRPSTGPTSCDRTTALGDVAFADGVAALALGDPVGAAAALTELRALSSQPGPRHKDLEKRFTTAFPFIAAKVARRVRATPAAAARSGPSSLSFAGDDLLVRTGAGVVRVAASGDEAPAEAPAWPQSLTTEDGAWTLGRVEQRCDQPVLWAVAKGPAGERDVPLPVLAPVSADGFPTSECRRAEIGAVPLGAARESFAFAVGGSMIALSLSGGSPVARLLASPVLADPPVTGGARATDFTVALPTPRGVVVWSANGARLWIGDALAGARGCVPAPGGARLACLVGAEAVLLEPDAVAPAGGR